MNRQTYHDMKMGGYPPPLREPIVIRAKLNELVGNALAVTYIFSVILVIVLNFIFGWNVFWQILGGAAAVGVLGILAFAVVWCWVQVWRASHRTKVN